MCCSTTSKVIDDTNIIYIQPRLTIPERALLITALCQKCLQNVSKRLDVKKYDKIEISSFCSSECLAQYVINSGIFKKYIEKGKRNIQDVTYAPLVHYRTIITVEGKKEKSEQNDVKKQEETSQNTK